MISRPIVIFTVFSEAIAFKVKTSLENILVNDRMEGLNQTTPQGEKGDYEEIPTSQEDPQQQKVKEEKYKLPSSYKNYPVLEITENAPKTIDEIIGMDKIKNELRENIIIPLNEQSVNVTLKANDIDIPLSFRPYKIKIFFTGIDL